MPDDKNIPLSPDATASEVAGTPGPLNVGSVEITAPKDNPAATVNLPNYVDVGGVEEGDKLEQENK